MSSISSRLRKKTCFHAFVLAGMVLIFCVSCKKDNNDGSGNTIPVATLIAPSGTTNIYPSDSLFMKANASDEDGSVSSVYFYVDNRVIFIDHSAPYEYWAGHFTEGIHSVSVAAMDNKSAMSKIASETVNVLSPGKMNVWITYNSNPYQYHPEGDSMVFKVISSSPFGKVTNVKFYMNSQLFGENTHDTSTFLWDPAVKGEWVLQAIVTDEKGNVGKSDFVYLTIVENNPPTVEFWSPSPNYVNIYNPWDSVVFQIHASDPENLLRKVELFADNVLIDYCSLNASSSFYGFTWKNVPPGTYNMKVRVTDRQGLTGVTEPLPITIMSGFKTNGTISDIITSDDPNVIFATNFTSGKLLLLNPVAKNLAATLDLPYDEPQTIDYSAPDKKLYIGYKFEGKISIYNKVTQQFSKYSFSPDVGASDVEVDEVNRRLYVLGTNSTLFIIDLDNGTTLLTIPGFTGDHLSVYAPGHLLFSEKTATNYVDLYKFSITAVTPQLIQQKQVGYSASQVLADPTGTMVVVPTGNFNKSNYNVYAYDVANINHVLGEWDFGTWCNRVAFNPDGHTVFGVNGDYYDDFIYAYDANTFILKYKFNFKKSTAGGIISPNSDGTKLVGITNNGYTPVISYIYFYDQ